MSKFSQAILNKIKTEKIKPKARWEFLLKDYFVWILSIVFLVVGGLVVAVIIHVLNNNDWDLYEHLSNNFLKFVLITLPYFWIILLILFIFVVYYNIRHTKQGYHYSLVLIVIASIVASIALGSAFYNLGLGRKLNTLLTETVGPYSRVFCHNTVVWHRPELGMLVGEVIAVEDQVCYLVDINNNKWEIITTRTNFSQGYTLMPGDRVKVLGKMISPGRLEAMEIRPIQCGCMMKHHKCNGRCLMKEK